LTTHYMEEADALADRVMIISAAFVPATAMPGWLPAFGIHQPVDALVNAERALILGGPAAPDVLISPAWSGGLLVVFALVAAVVIRRVLRHRRSRVTAPRAARTHRAARAPEARRARGR